MFHYNIKNIYIIDLKSMEMTFIAYNINVQFQTGWLLKFHHVGYYNHKFNLDMQKIEKNH